MALLLGRTGEAGSAAEAGRSEASSFLQAPVPAQGVSLTACKPLLASQNLRGLGGCELRGALASLAKLLLLVAPLLLPKETGTLELVQPPLWIRLAVRVEVLGLWTCPHPGGPIHGLSGFAKGCAGRY